MFEHFHAPGGWWTIVRKAVQEIGDDNCMGLAAQLAFYFLLGLFPAVLFLVVLISYLPVDDAVAELLAALGTVAPQELVRLLRAQFDQIAQGSNASLLTLGILGSIWSSSAAMVAIIDALNRAYDVKERRPWWRRRLVAILLTVALAVFLLIALTFVLIGPTVAVSVAEWIGLAPVVVFVWQVIRWPVIFVCVVLGVDLVYHFAPSRPGRWAWMTPGALLATGAWIACSFAFKFYVSNFGSYTATYGAIGGAVVTMLWFYVSGLAILIGAELNGVIEQTWRPRDEDTGRPESPAIAAAS